MERRSDAMRGARTRLSGTAAGRARVSGGAGRAGAGWAAAALGLLLAAPPAGADADAWQDRHMRSNAGARQAPLPGARVVVGEPRVAGDERAPTHVREQTLLHVSQHPWSGKGITASSAGPRAPRRDSGGTTATRHHGTPGARDRASTAGSALRGGVRSTGGR